MAAMKEYMDRSQMKKMVKLLELSNTMIYANSNLKIKIINDIRSILNELEQNININQ